ncbi:T9SS type A sorting domain-containing protein [Limibacter armeniacum]|uniref:T9SS type A sorting domain-containing protein n=1 Tax=Limibacter armeniacum TaxID=466084 RepID=UPI002FE6ACDB
MKKITLLIYSIVLVPLVVNGQNIHTVKVYTDLPSEDLVATGLVYDRTSKNLLFVNNSYDGDLYRLEVGGTPKLIVDNWAKKASGKYDYKESEVTMVDGVLYSVGNHTGYGKMIRCDQSGVSETILTYSEIGNYIGDGVGMAADEDNQYVFFTEGEYAIDKLFRYDIKQNQVDHIATIPRAIAEGLTYSKIYNKLYLMLYAKGLYEVDLNGTPTISQLYEFNIPNSNSKIAVDPMGEAVYLAVNSSLYEFSLLEDKVSVLTDALQLENSGGLAFAPSSENDSTFSLYIGGEGMIYEVDNFKPYNQVPELNCEATTINLSEDGTVEIDASQLNLNIFDDLKVMDTKLSKTFFDCNDIGTHQIEVVTTDVLGLSSSCICTVTIQDNTSPTIIEVPSDQDLDRSSTDSLATFSFVRPLASDNCSIAEYRIEVDNNAILIEDGDEVILKCSVGNTSVSFSAKDQVGNTTVESFVVSVANQAPVAICKDITIPLNENGVALVTAEMVDGGSSDDLGVESMEVDIEQFDCTQLGEQAVTLTVSDAAGLKTSCQAKVTIVDNAGPTFDHLPEDVVLPRTVGVEKVAYMFSLPETNDNCSISNMEVFSDNGTELTIEEGTVKGYFSVGVTKIVTKAFDNTGNKSESDVFITVENNEPTVVCQSQTVFLNESGEATVTAEMVDGGSKDDVGIVSMEVSKGVFSCDDLGTNIVVLSVTDTDGAEAKCETIISVEDTIPPRILNVPGDMSLQRNKSAVVVYKFDLPTFEDNCSIAGYSISASNDTKLKEIGGQVLGEFDATETVIDFVVTDLAGNSVQYSFKVSIENQPPIAICQDITVELDQEGIATITPEMINGGSSDDIGISLLECSKINFNCDDIGVTLVKLKVTDTDGAEATCKARVNIVDNLSPYTDFASENIIVKTSEGKHFAQVSFQKPNVIDNCGVASISYETDTGVELNDQGSVMSGNFPEGSTVVSFEALDFSGNVLTQSFEVKVESTGKLDLVFGGGLNCEADLPEDMAYMVDYSEIPFQLFRVNGKRDYSFVIGIIAGMRKDGKPGVWEVHDNCSIKPLREGAFRNNSELPNHAHSFVKYKHGWRLEVIGIDPDNPFKILGNAINDEGYKVAGGQCKAVRADNIPAGTVVPISWELSRRNFYGRVRGCMLEYGCDLVKYNCSNGYTIGCVGSNVRLAENDQVEKTVETSDILKSSFGESIEVYPNPASDTFRVDGKWKGSKEAVSLVLYDMAGMGHRISYYRWIGNSLEVDISRLGLSTGMYLLQLSDGEQTHQMKLGLR